MQIKLSLNQLSEVELLIDGFRAAQTYGLGEIHRDSGTSIIWNEDRIMVEIPEDDIDKTD